ncbi:MAG: FG-GAP-like repeat-containing protein [Anaerolineae bacterium]
MSQGNGFPGYGSYSSWQEIDRPKPLLPNTELARDGVPKSAIVTPGRPAYLAQAHKLADAIRKVGQVSLPIYLDTQLAPWQPPDSNIILLGNLVDNCLVPPLYARHYVAADGFYPGKGGFVLNTVHDPWGNGHNIVFVGGSDIEGVAESAESLIASLERKEGTLLLPPLLQVKLGESVIARVPGLAAEPDEAFIEKEIADAHHMLETSAHGGITDPLARAGFYYHLTGKLGWAELFKRLAYLMYEDFQRGREQYGGPWGMDADFRLHKMMPAWDLVEEAPIFTAEDRLQITRIYAQFIRDCIPHADAALRDRLARHNHTTFAALGLLYAGLYFQKYYGLCEANDWLHIADECFIPQCQGSRPIEDSNGYQWVTLEHTLRYSLARPYPPFLEDGHLRQACDLVIASLDNLGYQASYGDTGNPFGWGSELPLLSAAAWYYRDGRYQWALQRQHSQPFHLGVAGEIGSYNAGIEPVEPREHAGITCLPLDRRFYISTKGPDHLPFESAFDKLAFRAGFHPDSECLLLDGLSCGGHRHYDGNSFIRLTALGRIWLADCDYYCSTPNFHNGILPWRNGRSEIIPPFTRREIVADLANCGFSRTTVKGYAGCDWERNIIWRKGRYFLVADVMRALADGQYDFRALWRVLGESEVRDSTLEVRQQDRALAIINGDGATLGLKADTLTSRNWQVYKFAEPIVHVLQQDKSQVLGSGQVSVFLNVLYPHLVSGALPEAKRVGDGSLLLKEKDGIGWLGTATVTPPQSPGATDATMWCIMSSSISLAQATYLRCGTFSLQADRPLSIELDLTSGRGVAITDFATLVTLKAPKVEVLALDGHQRAFASTDGSIGFTVPEGRHEFALQPWPAGAQWGGLAVVLALAWEQASRTPTGAAALAQMQGEEPAWALPSESTFTVLCPVEAAGQTLVAAGDDGGRIWLLSPQGAVLWRVAVGGKATALVVAGFTEKGPVVVAGSDACAVSAIDLSGRLLWQYQVPYYKRDGIVRVLLAADLNGDGCDEVIVGAENWHYYALDREGKLLWQYESVHASTAAAVADVDGDGQPELLAGTEYYWWHCVSAQGKRKWQHNTVYGPGVTAVATFAGDDAGKLIAFGCVDGSVQVVDHEGRLRFVLPTADQVTGLAVADLDGDSREELVVASASNNVYAIKDDGNVMWRQHFQDTPRHLCLLAMPGKQKEIVVVEDDGLLHRLGADGKELSSFSIGVSPVVALLPEQRLLVASSPEVGLQAWRL